MEIYKQGYKVEDIQVKLLTILLELDKICKENNIKYCLDGGTLLGAVRHSGFIPWDDDVDVAMLRKDYQKFIKVCKTKLNKTKFIFECIENSRNYEYNFGKLKLLDTIAIEIPGKNVRSNKGLWIDVFPLDKTTRIFYPFQQKMASMWQYVRWKKIGYLGKSKYDRLVTFLSKVTTTRCANHYANFAMKIMNWLPCKSVSKICHPGKRKGPHSKEFYINTFPKLFVFQNNEYKFPIPINYEKWLEMRYGNWIQLPPDEQRRPSHNLDKLKI